MAMSSYDLPHLTPLDIFNGQTTNTPLVRGIQGRSVIANYTLSDLPFGTILSDDEIKLRLCNEIAAELYKQNMIEFTKQRNYQTDDIHYRARIFAVPNSDVQLLRIQEIIK